jgi:hypothetical protein
MKRFVVFNGLMVDEETEQCSNVKMICQTNSKAVVAIVTFIWSLIPDRRLGAFAAGCSSESWPDILRESQQLEGALRL